MKFRKKPVIIEAVLYQAEFGNNRIINWLAQQGASVEGWLFFDGEITIPTLEGRMKVSDCDWIIRGVKGEFYPCKPDIFSATYEDVSVGEPGSLLPNRVQEIAELVSKRMDEGQRGTTLQEIVAVTIEVIEGERDAVSPSAHRPSPAGKPGRDSDCASDRVGECPECGENIGRDTLPGHRWWVHGVILPADPALKRDGEPRTKIMNEGE